MQRVLDRIGTHGLSNRGYGTGASAHRAAWPYPVAPESPMVSPGRRIRCAAAHRGAVVTENKNRASRSAARRAAPASLFEVFASQAPIGIFASDAQGRCIYVNARCCAMFGATPADLLDDGYIRTLHPEDRDRVLAGWREALAAGRTCESESRRVRPDGSAFWALCHAAPVAGAGEIAYLGTVVDITERKNAEFALRASRNTAQAVLDASPLAIVSLDAAGGVQAWSRGAERLFGWREPEVIGRPCPAIAPDDLAEFRELIAGVLKDGAVPGRVYSCRNAEGQALRASVSVAPLANGAGERVGAVATFDDLTAYEAMLGRLRQLIDDHQRLVQDLHDTCIQSIFAVGLSLEECRRLVTVNPAKAVSAIGAAAANLNLVIHDLRAFISPEAASHDIRDFRDELLRAVEAVGTQAPRFEVDVDDAAVGALEPAQVAQLLHIAHEGISNIVRHARARVARVALRLTERCIRLEISDDGRGFDHRASERRGLGLHHIRARTAKLRARLRLASTTGRGTRLYVDLPRPA